jgi:hypothetical protein
LSATLVRHIALRTQLPVGVNRLPWL